jgi:hypothetical protein
MLLIIKLLFRSHVVEIKRPDVPNKFLIFVQHLQETIKIIIAILRADVNCVLQLLHHVVAGDLPDVSEVHAASIFRVDVCRLVKMKAARTSEMSATLPATEDGGSI